ncbi:putative toxin-antitoxin system toxin component, PIN family [Mucilaginibacter sp.]|uniref:putative toxin-antitoxin system toxin component, PIN family n=1 Tax=Mucilaginibacter sp. TaxID=1882438 RepID=UPI0035BC68D1
MTIVFDCNIYISLAINQQIDLIPRVHQKGITIASCDQLLIELLDVFNRPKLSRYLSTLTINDILQLIRITTTWVQLTDIPEVVSDKKDNYLFALCKKSKANYFITGDKLLLAEEKYEQTNIISLADFRLLIA